MATYATGKLRQKILGKDPFFFSDEILRTDLQRIVRYYQREGFLYAGAEISELNSDAKSRTVEVVIMISEGDSISVRNVDWQVTDSSQTAVDSAVGEQRASLKTRSGRRFRDAAVNSDRQILARALENAGYPYCRVTPELVVDEEDLAADIVWVIQPGPRCKFGQITIEGNERAGQGLIRGALALKTGDWYSRQALENSQRRIYGLSIFHVATVVARLSGSQETTIPIDIRVKEAPRLSSKIGFGYGREEKLRVYSDSYYLGFLGGARRLNLYAKHSDLEPYHFSLRFIQPAFITSFTTLELRPFILRQEEPAFTENRYGGQVALLREFAHYLHGSVTYMFERVDLDTATVADVPDAELDLSDAYNKSSLLPGLTFDNSSPIFAPSQGFYIALASKISGLGMGSDFHFTRLLLDVRRYHPVFGIVVAGRIKGGGINSGDEHGFIPLEDRFYAGGSASVRGWARAELGPADDEGTPIGGNSLLEGSLSLRFPIIGVLSGAVFYDFGNVWLGSYTYHLDDLRYSAGIGVRVGTPIGPVRLDVARPVFDEETTGQIHISVGEAF